MWLLVDGEVAAGGWGVPFAWDGSANGLPSGYDAALVQAVEDQEAGRPATAFSFMAAAVHPDHDKRGLAAAVLQALTDRARSAGIHHVFAPIRPTWKPRYPLVPLAEYATWVREDGLSIGPWIRTHQRMGARIVGPAPDSMVIPGTVARVGTVGGHALPRVRPIRRSRCAQPPACRSRTRHGDLPRGESLDAALLTHSTARSSARARPAADAYIADTCPSRGPRGQPPHRVHRRSCHCRRRAPTARVPAGGRGRRAPESGAAVVRARRLS